MFKMIILSFEDKTTRLGHRSRHRQTMINRILDFSRYIGYRMKYTAIKKERSDDSGQINIYIVNTH